MNFYKVYINSHGASGRLAPEEFILVREGFNTYSLVFGILWAVYKRMWLLSGLYVFIFLWGIAMRAGFALSNASVTMWSLCAYIIIGFCANDLYGVVLMKKGWQYARIVCGKDEDEASLRFLDSY